MRNATLPTRALSALAAFTAAAALAGCPQDQVRNFLRARLVLTPRQLRASAAARLCDADGGPTEIAYGGARGGGKSFWLLAQVAADDLTRLPGAKALVLRRVGKANLEHLEDLRHSTLHHIPHEFNPTRGIISLPNGSRLVAGHFQREADIDAYLGLE